jgi:fused signal recognition particle receptor
VPGFFNRFWQGLQGTREQVGGQLRRLLGRSVGPEFFEELEEQLYLADLGPDAVEHLLARARERLRTDRPIDEEALLGLLAEEMAALLPDDVADPWTLPPERPQVWVIVGVNGTGKTTTVGKLAAAFGRRGARVVIGAADTFRAAAVEQLAVWADRAGAQLIQQAPGADPAAVAFDAVAAARRRGADLVLVDTAGRLHTKAPLMQELGKVVRVIGREYPGAPHQRLLVLDATTGQNGLIQARQFADAAGADGIVLTKLDSTAKGGVVLAIQQQMRLPVRWVGMGEQVDDLVPFRRQDFVRALVGLEPLESAGSR